MGLEMGFVVAALAFILVTGTLAEDEINRPTTSSCNKLNTAFSTKHIYTYQYTMTTSSGFVGTSPLRSGSKLTCKVTLEVPRKCEVIMKLTECNLQERNTEIDTGYLDVVDSDLTQQLERYAVYFQINEGLIVPDTIASDVGETVTAMNIKRGFMSAIQFNLKDIGQTVQQTSYDIYDVFGVCPTTYVYDADNRNQAMTKRNIPDCTLHQIYETQFPVFSTTVRAVSGGLIDNTINEKIYPFDSKVSCKFLLRDEENTKVIDNVACDEHHFLMPTAFRDEQQTVYTANVNVSQKIVLISVEHKNQPEPDRSLDGRKIVSLAFDYGHPTDDGTLAKLDSAMADLKDLYMNNDVENVPIGFEKVVLTMRKCDTAVLNDLMTEVFSCGEECTPVDKAVQTFYLDGLMSCGTANCQVQMFECIEHDHVAKFRSSEFMYGLALLDNVDETVKERMLEYCRHSGTMRCWLPLGTVLSKTDTTNLPAKSAMYQTVTYLTQELLTHCSAEQLQVAPRYLITGWKVLGNIGYKKIRETFGMTENSRKMTEACLTNPAVPDSVFYVILKEMEWTSVSYGFKNKPPPLVEMLFVVLKDTSRHNNIRSLAFSILYKTDDDAVIERLLDFIKAGDNHQLMMYMVTSIVTLYENDQPDMQHVREAWKKHPDPTSFIENSHQRYYPYTSKPIYFGHFYKLPFTEFFGGVVLIDLIYDPTAYYYSSLSVQLNYYIDGVRYNVFELTINSHGIEQLMMILNMKPEEMPSLISSILLSFDKLKEQMDSQKPEFGFPEFQSFLAKKVAEIIKQVNYPKFMELKDFDVFVDLKRSGKSYAFISLQEVIGLMRMFMTRDPGYSQKVLMNLLNSIDDDSFKAVEFGSIYKVIPTCAGLPLNMTVEVVGWNRIISNIKSNLIMFIGGKATDLTAGLKQYILFNTIFRGELHLPIDQSHSSGLKGLFKIGSERDVQLDAVWGMKEDGTRKFFVDFAPISEDRTSETVFYARGRLFVQHDQIWDEIPPEETVQSTYERCFSDEFQLALGRSVCATFVYPKVGQSKSHPYFPLSGPFDLDIVMAKEDGVNSYHITIDYIDSEQEMGLMFTNSAEGTKLNRHSTFDILHDKTKNSFVFHLVSSMFGVEYKYVLDVSQRDSFEISEYLWMMKEAIGGYKLKGSRNGNLNNLNFNLALPGISWDWDITTSKLEYAKIVYTYYCSQKRPLLYLLHLSPTHAMEHGDKTVVTFTANLENEKDPKTKSVSLEMMEDKIELSVTKTELAKILEATYSTDSYGTTHFLTAKVTVNSGENVVDGPMVIEIDGSDFGLDIAGSTEGNIQDFHFTSDIQYDKEKVDNNLSRRRRSVNNIIHDALLASLYENKDPSIVKRSADLQLQVADDVQLQVADNAQVEISPTEKMVLSKLPNVPSIWDIPKWKSNLEVTGKLSVVQEERDKYPSTKLELQIHVLHPWMGGYRDTTVDLQMGMGTVMTLQNFKAWAAGNSTTLYTNLDETPLLDGDGEPQKFVGGGESHVNRQAGKLFDLGIHHWDPYVQFGYEILFDWDATTHHEPLIHVVSQQTNALIPAFNHHYEEKLSIEDKHWIHSLEFYHRLISYNVTSDFHVKDPEDGIFLTQTGTLDFPLMYGDKVYTFNTVMEKPSLSFRKGIDIKYVAEIQSSDNPGHTEVLTYFFKDKQFGVRGGEKTTENPEEVPLWSYIFELQETTMTWTVSWTDEANEVMRKLIIDRTIGPGIFLKTYAAKIKENMKLPFMKQPFFFTQITTEEIQRDYIKPYLMKGIVAYNTMMANFVPQDRRKGPEGKLTPRVYTMFQIVKNFREQEPNRAIFFGHRLHYFAIHGLSNGFLYIGTLMMNDPRYSAAVDNKLGYHKWTTPFVLTSNQYVFYKFEQRQVLKQTLSKIRSLKQDHSGRLDHNLAVLFKYDPYKSGAEFSVRTFGGYIYNIPAGTKMRSGKYLLAADVIQQRYSLLLTPNGLELISPAGSVVFGWNNDIYISDCYDASIQNQHVIGDNVISWERQDDEILVNTNFGLTLSCDMTWSKVCFVGLQRNLRNTTIGLLGTNTEDKFVDRRGLNGHIITDDAEFVSEYCLEGCFVEHEDENSAIAPPPESCKETMKATCDVAMKTNRYWLYNCRQAAMDIRYEVLQEICRETASCDTERVGACKLIKVFWNLLRRSCKVRESIDKPVPCGLTPIPVNAHDPNTPVVDIVYVVSLYEYNQVFANAAKLVIDATVEPYIGDATIRIGMVGFNGEDSKKSPFVVGQAQGYSAVRSMLELSQADFGALEAALEATGNDDSGAMAVHALQVAAEMPFSTSANKIIVLVVPPNEDIEENERLEHLKEELLDRHITLKVFSTYWEFAGQDDVAGITSDGNAILSDGSVGEYVGVPDRYYTELVSATQGSFWDVKKFTAEGYITYNKLMEKEEKCPAA